MTVVTRFAPSPTGYLHIGGARTALFSWAYAKRHQGKFILRIEDTDLERSTPEAVKAIMDGMTWLHLNYDEGPIYQTKRMATYKTYIDQLLKEDKAYLCYSSKEELEVLRESQMKAGLKPKYDGKWRPESGKSLPPTPKNIQPVVRFKNPTSGVVSDIVFMTLKFACGTGTGVTVDDIAKRLMDHGFHAPTVSFPVAGTMMIEPTESEDIRELDRFLAAMESIRSEIAQIESGKITIEDSPLRHAPHTIGDLVSQEWDRKYSRENAAFPNGQEFGIGRAGKYLPTVGRIDGVYGDRNLVCSCLPIEELASN